MMPFSFRRTVPLFAAAILATSLTACLETAAPEQEEPDIEAVVVSAVSGGNASGSTTLTAGPSQSGSLTLKSGVDNAVTVRILGVDLLDLPEVAEDPANFEIRFVEEAGTAITSSMGAGYPRPFSVRPAVAGTYTWELQVVAIDHGHVEFRAPIAVTVQ